MKKSSDRKFPEARALRGMSGAECKKTMLCGQAVVFSASFPSRLSVLLTHLALAFAVLQKREKNNACYEGY